MLRPCKPISARTSLPSSYVIFAGSAVSGWAGGQPFLPLVDEALRALAAETAARLRGGTDAEELASGYADRMAGGDLKVLLRRAKFEDVLLRLSRVVGEESVVRLLDGVFGCDRGQFGENHAAIAALMSPGGPVDACLTTNYDNGVERALEEKGIDFDTFDFQSFDPVAKHTRPYVLKLHGGVGSGRYIFTTEHQYLAMHKKNFVYLESLLANRLVTVIGYSGEGDTDVAPHVLEARGQVVWINRERAPWDADWWKTDLRSLDPRQNALLSLVTPPDRAFGNRPAAATWREAMRDWASDTDRPALRVFVDELLGLGRGWLRLRLHHTSFETSTVKTALEIRKGQAWLRGLACLDVSAYYSADQAFDEASYGQETEAEWLLWKGFIRWRLGRLREALGYLDRASRAGSDRSRLQIRADSLRMYLEVAVQLLRQRRTRDERCRLSEELKVGEFRKHLTLADQTDYPGDILTVFVFALHDLLTDGGHDVNWRQVKANVLRARRLRYWAIAEAGARLLVERSLWYGLMDLLSIDLVLLRRGSWNTLRKSLAALAHACTPFHPALILDLLDGHVFGEKKAALIEARYRWNRNHWRRVFASKGTSAI